MTVELLAYANRQKIAEALTERGYSVTRMTVNRWAKGGEMPAIAARMILALFGHDLGAHPPNLLLIQMTRQGPGRQVVSNESRDGPREHHGVNDWMGQRALPLRWTANSTEPRDRLLVVNNKRET